MEKNVETPMVEVDYIKIPVFLFHGDPETIQGSLVYTIDNDGIRTLITPEEEAKNILYSSILQTKEEQEIINKFKEEDDLNSNHYVIEIPLQGKNFIKHFNYKLSLEFVGYNEENSNPQFIITHDTITGSPQETMESMKDAKNI